jgi:hypothetical protein
MMIRLAVTLLLASTVLAENYPIQERETIKRTLEFAGSGMRILELDNVNGAIHATGYDGSTVEMTANKTIRARSQDGVQTAKQEVKLDITDKSEVLRIYVEGPFRDNWRSSWRYSGYEVDFDFDVRVPRDVKVRLRTVNGEVQAEKIAGDFEVRGVNGRIAMTDINGSGSAETVNGEVKVGFLENPKSSSFFKTINGAIEIAFQPGLSANLQLKTFNGGLFTDFPVTSIPSTSTGTSERRNGKFIYRSNRFTSVRVGNGGPEITIDGFNSEVRILSRTR